MSEPQHGFALTRAHDTRVSLDRVQQDRPGADQRRHENPSLFAGAAADVARIGLRRQPPQTGRARWLRMQGDEGGGRLPVSAPPKATQQSRPYRVAGLGPIRDTNPLGASCPSPQAPRPRRQTRCLRWASESVNRECAPCAPNGGFRVDTLAGNRYLIRAGGAYRVRGPRGRARTVKAYVDQDLCIGCGLCAETCPDVFAMDGEKAKVVADPVPSGAAEACKDAACACPVEAIRIEP